MPSDTLEKFLSLPAAARPVLLEGRWLDQSPEHCWAAAHPEDVFEGSGEKLAGLPAWLDLQARKHPAGAAVGIFSYELARHFELLSLPTQTSLPDFSFAYYPHIERVSIEAVAAPQTRQDMRIETPIDFPAFETAVERIRTYIAAGDIYQANLTLPFSARVGGETAESIYRRMRGSGAPFRAFIKTPDRTILSNSPERFFHVKGDHILTSPIKGTIARDRHDQQESRAALMASEKDRAENLMIVDLLRNDLGRICDYSSIRTHLWQTEELPQLLHLVSHVEGTLRPGQGILEIARALFPCGSITGAPKIRAMQILAEIEQRPRGVSMGAIGIIRGSPGPDGGRMDFNVAIRTMTIEHGLATFNVGGGIVYDSDPVAEYEEVMLKAKPLFEALGQQRCYVISRK